MYYLDFFSDSPKNYIFQKEANKTKFGGFLFFIYMIIMLLISLAYILDYFVNDKYIVEYTRFFNSSFDSGERRRFDKNFDYEMSFKFSILNHDKQTVPENEFSLFFHQVLINQNELVKCSLSNFYLKIYYNCQNENCEQKTKSRFYYLRIEYNGFELYHQNNSFPPLQKNGNKTFIFLDRFNFDFPSNIFLNWEYIKYEEEKGVSQLLNPFQTNKDEFSSGFISSSSSILQEKNYNDIDDLKLLSIVDLERSELITKYKRKKNGILDVISKLGALFSTIRICFLFFFKYYSNNFNNYKIIEKILFSSNYNINKKIELSRDLEKSEINLTKEEDKKIDNKIIAPLIPENSSEKKISINDNILYGDNNDDEEEDKPLKELPKYSFIDFFFNVIYFKKCLKIERQEIINVYNEIIFKYFSVDAILNNQIKLENLFKDYHWNNPSLNNIQNNQLIIKLKKMINS